MRKKYFSVEDQIEAKLSSNRKTSKLRKRKNNQHKIKKFMGWDGEGVTINGQHRYNLLMHSQDGYLFNEEGLNSTECFNFLCDIGEEFKDYIHVIFAGTYDVTMMLKGIPEKFLVRLHKTGKVYWKNFSLEYHPKKYFQIKRYDPDMFIHKRRRKYNAKIVLWDVFGFFQSSFLEAMNTFFTEEEKENLGYETIKEGKADRSEFTLDKMAETVIPYTRLEVEALTQLMHRLYNEYCLKDTPPIVLRRFDGAGAIAHSVLTSYRVKTYYPQNEQKPEPHKTPIPPDVMIASQHAYGGGRIEIIKYGHYDGNIYRYDINSAYPSENIKLVDLSTGVWSYQNSGDMSPLPGEMADYKVLWDYTEHEIQPFYPFFYRSLHGDITFPQYGLNWVWTPELQAALKWNDKLKGRITILEKWLYTPGTSIKPFAFIQEMYDTRRKLKAAGHGMQLVKKLSYNSFYGKQVQHLGYEDHNQRGETKWRPPFFQLQNGGMITSGVRAKMFDVAMQRPHAIIGFATDGLWSTEELNLDTGDDLGQWEYDVLSSATFVQSGVYWLHKPSTKKVEVACPQHGWYCEMIQHFRGFDRKNLKEAYVLQHWQNKQEKLQVKTTRFIPLGQGLILKDKTLLGSWHESTRELKLHPTDGKGKRQPFYRIKAKTKHIREYPPVSPELGLIPTIPNNMKVGLNSKGEIQISDPFPLPWEVDRIEYNNLRDETNLEREIVNSIEEQYEE